MPRLVNSPYSLLAVAIVVQAIKDWDDATKLLAVDPDNEKILAEIVDIECFFKSEWFQVLKGLAPENLYDEMLEDYKNDKKRIS